ncbi:hypothetical protein SASPL_109501 [Salvia splendens]|uniref:Disease resistance protein RPM1 n=1 Tax=Salvia splendens TaxID=180675 RepID=A0A8X8YIQ6_SALSN|nr:hypothetical protein SASPL_109501 [Salvia splendens]
MAYNLQSLITIIQRILNPEESLWIVEGNTPQLQSLLQKAESLFHILEKSSLTNIPINLESRIIDVSYKAEDIIESNMVRQMLSTPQGSRLTFFTPNLHRVIQLLDFATEKVVKHVEGKAHSTGLSSSHDLSPHVQQTMQQLQSVKLEEVDEIKMPVAVPLSSSKNNLVGVDADMLQLVRALDVMGMLLEKFPKEILQLVNLRYLAINCSSGLPDEISRLHNLHTLICPHFMPYVPSELWEMYELRHIRFKRTIMKFGKIKFDLKKLQTLSTMWITPKLISSGCFEGIPNIIKMGIYYEDSPNIEVDLSHLHKLEILHCESKLDKDGSRFLHKLRFPSNLRKLTLRGCVVFRSLCATLCTLPNLEVLRIVECLESLNLVHWKADETNFPKLQRLFVARCHKLEEIPNAMGDIPTLQEIGIYECGASIVASAQQILKVQREEYDNFDLKLYIRWNPKGKYTCSSYYYIICSIILFALT